MNTKTKIGAKLILATCWSAVAIIRTILWSILTINEKTISPNMEKFDNSVEALKKVYREMMAEENSGDAAVFLARFNQRYQEIQREELRLSRPIDPVVVLIIRDTNTGQYLVQEHKSRKYGFMSGRIEEKDVSLSGDKYTTASNAVKREANEELGLVLEYTDILYVTELSLPSQYPEHVNGEMFTCSVWSMEWYPRWGIFIKNMEPDVCLGLSWVSLDELQRLNNAGKLRISTQAILTNEILSKCDFS